MFATTRALEGIKESAYALTRDIKTNYRKAQLKISIVEFDCLGGESLPTGFEEIAYQFVPAGAIQSPLSYH